MTIVNRLLMSLIKTDAVQRFGVQFLIHKILATRQKVIQKKVEVQNETVFAPDAS